MSVLLTSPAYLLAIPALALVRRSRVVAGAAVAVAAIAMFDLMHFSQGWVQFGIDSATTPRRSRCWWSLARAAGAPTRLGPAAATALISADGDQPGSRSGAAPAW
jgi:hypothetical protein